jgi:hypothetical protein
VSKREKRERDRECLNSSSPFQVCNTVNNFLFKTFYILTFRD